MIKSYIECLNEISKDELYEGLVGYGLFAERIPNFLSSEGFFNFAKNNTNLRVKNAGYIKYEGMRNINVPRYFSIPNPFAYHTQCITLRDEWDKIQKYFAEKTKGDKYKISRIHIRKIVGQKALQAKDSYDNNLNNEQNIEKHLFEMNHRPYKQDGNPEQSFCIGKRYKVKADISNCFPSIYTHAIPWAIFGKNQAKEEKNTKNFANKLDETTRQLNNNESIGILIGPHSSNLISEIILVAIDSELKKYSYVRNIDDYTCYTESREEAEQFILNLSQCLKKFNLSLNHKKTQILELPLPFEEDWLRQLKTFRMDTYNRAIKYPSVVAFLDTAVKLMQENNDKASILNYAIKILHKKKMTNGAKIYFFNAIHHLTLLYPYLTPLLELLFDNKENTISLDKQIKISTDIYKLGINTKNFEACSYAIYFALKYKFELQAESKRKILNHEEILESNDCIFMLLGYLYAKSHNEATQSYINKAGSFIIELKSNTESESNKIDDECWLFTYEVLRQEKPDKLDRCGHWTALRDSNTSFIKDAFYTKTKAKKL